MKKFFTIIILMITAALSFSLVACGDNPGDSKTDGDKTEGALTREEICAMLPNKVKVLKRLTSGFCYEMPQFRW